MMRELEKMNSILGIYIYIYIKTLNTKQISRVAKLIEKTN